ECDASLRARARGQGRGRRDRGGSRPAQRCERGGWEDHASSGGGRSRYGACIGGGGAREPGAASGLMGRLDEVDLSLKLGRTEQDERLAAAQERLSALRLQLGGLIGDGRLGPPVCMLFEGWDASGKGGAIKRLTAQLDHRHVRVAAFAA